MNGEIMFFPMRPTLDERFHRMTGESPLEEFRQKLLDRQIMAMRRHARWAARKIAFNLSQQYQHGEMHYITDVLMNRQLRGYNVDPGVYKYGKKVIKEKLKELWA